MGCAPGGGGGRAVVMPKPPQAARRGGLALLALLAAAVPAGWLFILGQTPPLQTARFDPRVHGPAQPASTGAGSWSSATCTAPNSARDNADLFAAVAAEEPDRTSSFLGDLEDKYRGPAARLSGGRWPTGLSAIAPTYYVTGNHEWAIGERAGAEGDAGRPRGHGAVQPVRAAGARTGTPWCWRASTIPNGYADQKTPEELAAEVYAACGDPFWLLLAHRSEPLRLPVQPAGGGPGAAPATATAASSACPSRTGCCPTEHGPCSPPTPPGCMWRTAPACSSPGGWGTPAPPSGCFNRPEVAVADAAPGGALVRMAGLVRGDVPWQGPGKNRTVPSAGPGPPADAPAAVPVSDWGPRQGLVRR